MTNELFIGIDPSILSTAMTVFVGGHRLPNIYSYPTYTGNNIPGRLRRNCDELSEKCGLKVTFTQAQRDRKNIAVAKKERDTTKAGTSKILSAQAIKDAKDHLDEYLNEVNEAFRKVDLANAGLYIAAADNHMHLMESAMAVSRSIVGDILLIINEEGFETANLYFTIEAPALQSTGSSSYDLAAFCAVIRDVPRILSTNPNLNVVYTLVPPTSIKNFATYSGAATKEQMCESFTAEDADIPLVKFAQSIDTEKVGQYKPLDDIIDSYFMAKYSKILI